MIVDILRYPSMQHAMKRKGIIYVDIDNDDTWRIYRKRIASFKHAFCECAKKPWFGQSTMAVIYIPVWAYIIAEDDWLKMYMDMRGYKKTDIGSGINAWGYVFLEYIKTGVEPDFSKFPQINIGDIDSIINISINK